jgi:hypothetical protein
MPMCEVQAHTRVDAVSVFARLAIEKQLGGADVPPLLRQALDREFQPTLDLHAD